MSDDLVEQLRAKRVYSDEGNCWADPGCSEAADRIEHLEDRCANLLVENGILNNHIEKLEAALRDIIDERGICGHCGQLATGEGKRNFVICDKNVLGFEGPCHWTPQDPKDIARKALEGKDD